jgi:AcrR family transcriptional regulator
MSRRDEIAAVAIRVADAEGLDAVSMRRVAKELGAGTMSLYHYVRDKDDLVDLMTDLVLAEYLVDPAELEHGWRDALAAIARSTRDALRRHPWVLASGAMPALGPNTLAHVDQTAQAAAQTGAAPADYMEWAGLLDEYVIGCLMRETSLLRPERRVDPDHWQRLLESGAYPHIAAVVDAHTAAGGRPEELRPNEDAEGLFERGLQLVLDGIALQIERGR